MVTAASRQAAPSPAPPTAPADDAAEALDRLGRAAATAEAAPDVAQAVAALRPLFEDVRWLHALARATTQSLSADPFHLFGMTAMTSGALQQLLFVSGPRASVTLGTLGRLDGKAASPPTSHAFVGNRSLLRILSPEPLDGRIALLSRVTGLCRDRPIRIMPNRIFDMDERRRVLWIAPPPRQALFLRARVRRLPAPLVGTYGVGEDRPRALANGDDGLARSLAMIAVLRTLGKAPPLDALRALLPRAHGAQRWALMREMLAVDTAAAWPDLTHMAGAEPDGAIRDAASRLITRLTPRSRSDASAHPTPAQEAAPCQS
ncbi:hypothetical protein LWE61_01555 [Sphingobium sufflavum]|uniref:hypothetical protein n=1 Tax=Sphingobium sufflavum TaxID=1129547 RepID=UPI001F47ACC0|nr:hypothetical protein [Sphingobium sufflavum]MCE7795236.1 hypothetical protein [Sphingobium sufflavum]